MSRLVKPSAVQSSLQAKSNFNYDIASAPHDVPLYCVFKHGFEDEDYIIAMAIYTNFGRKLPDGTYYKCWRLLNPLVSGFNPTASLANNPPIAYAHINSLI